MLLGYPLKQVPVVTLSGTGAAWINTPNGGGNLINGNPQSVARLQWLSAVSPTISDYVEIQLTWDVANHEKLRVANLIGRLNLPVGLKMEVYGRESGEGSFDYPLGGNSLSQRVIEEEDGQRTIRWAFDSGLDNMSGIALRIYNDVAGATIFTNESYVDLGEFLALPAVEIYAAQGLDWQYVDPSNARRALGSALYVTPRRPYRTMGVGSILEDFDSHYTDANGRISLKELAARNLGNSRSIIYPCHDTQDEIQAYGAYGRLVTKSTKHRSWKYSNTDWTFDEIPG